MEAQARSRQWTPRVNGRLASMDASRQWTPRLCYLRILNQHVRGARASS